MQTDFEVKYHALEEEHWWFRARRDAVLSIVRGMDLSPRALILDAGCASGMLMRSLGEEGFTEVEGIDISAAAVEGARARGLTRVQVMDAADLRFGDGTLDLIVASDILEHISDDRRALSSWMRALKPGGRLVVFVPAFQALWSSHDEVNQHYRRYTRRHLISLLDSSGFQVLRASYWNAVLFAPVAAVRLLMRATRRVHAVDGDQLRVAHPIVNHALLGLLKLENRLLAKGVNWPLGVSVFAIAQRN